MQISESALAGPIPPFFFSLSDVYSLERVCCPLAIAECSACLKNENVFGQVCALDAISPFSETQYMLRLFPPGFKEINVEFDPWGYGRSYLTRM